MIIDEKQLEDVARAICLRNLRIVQAGQQPEWKEQQYIDAVNEDWPEWTPEAKAAIEAAFKPRPIEEAPKDGTKIILTNDHDLPFVGPCQWQEPDVISENGFWLWWQNEPEHLTEIVSPSGYIPIPQEDT